MMAFLAWFDNSTTARTQKISAGRAAFQERYGITPDVCLMRSEDQHALQLSSYDGVRIDTHPDVPTHTLWFGMEEIV